MKLHQAVAKRILEYGEEKGCSTNKICVISNVTQSTVNGLFSGRSQNPKLATIYHLCNGLGITLKDFFDSPLFENIEE